MNSFSEVLPFPAAVQNLEDLSPHFNLENLHSLWKKMGYTGHMEEWQKTALNQEEHNVVTQEQFAAIMKEHFSVEESMLGFVNQIFQELDKDKTGELTFPELCLGMMKVLGDPEEQLRFTFQMYDLDKSGKIDVNEVEMMLRATGVKLSNNTMELER